MDNYNKLKKFCVINKIIYITLFILNLILPPIVLLILKFGVGYINPWVGFYGYILLPITMVLAVFSITLKVRTYKYLNQSIIIYYGWKKAQLFLNEHLLDQISGVSITYQPLKATLTDGSEILADRTCIKINKKLVKVW